MKKTKCDACGAAEIRSIYTLERIPPFQNKLYPTAAAALEAPTAQVDLAACPSCGLVFNALFDDSVMDYDADYQNEQGHSPQFKSHLDAVADLVMKTLSPGVKIAEIGCGKGAFLSILRGRGVDIKGFDPAYEGDDPSIVKAYFDAKTAKNLAVDAIVMRHTLEHIESPFAFLAGLKAMLPPETRIFIEIPRFEWIVEHKSFWDVFHEHCNYFSEVFFQGAFSGRAEIAQLFDQQYMLVSARLGDLADAPRVKNAPVYGRLFDGEIDKYKKLLTSAKHNIVWGAGAKGVAFANVLDPKRQHIDAIVDINPRKQQQFCPLTGHPVLAPAAVDWSSFGADSRLWIMNALYKKEILASLPELRCNVIAMGETAS